MSRKYLVTSESVSEGHPDKIADQMSDAILDAIIADDPMARVACESLVTTGLAMIAGEITTTCWVDMPEVIRNTIKEIGYTKPDYGFDHQTCAVLTTIGGQSPDISQGVTEGEGLHAEQGAGDQGMMIGYACHETKELMPLPIMLAHKLMMKVAELRKKEVLKYLRPDGKSQVTVEYDGNKPIRVSTVVVSVQHDPDVKYGQIESDMIEHVVKATIPAEYLDKNTIYHVNPTGRFVVGGPQGDSGITGRKIIVDTYGGAARHGGGAFSGKDPTKVDRSASYAARYVAKNLVAAGLADRCEVQIAYAIGVAEPIAVNVDTFDTGVIENEKISEIVTDLFDLRPKSIIDGLDLLRPIYKKTAAYGHFGRELEEFTWERTDRAEEIKKAAGI